MIMRSLTPVVDNTIDRAGICAAEGQLVLAKGDMSRQNRLTIDGLFYNPLVIAKTTHIMKGDLMYDIKGSGGMITATQDGPSRMWRKVLVAPDQVSAKDVYTISKGGMCDGDDVLVECRKITKAMDQSYDGTEYRVRLNDDNNAIIMPAEQTLEQYLKDEGYITDEYDIMEIPTHALNEMVLDAVKAGIRWEKGNNR